MVVTDRVVRRELGEFVDRPTRVGVVVLLVDLAAYAAGLGVLWWWRWWPVQALYGVLNGLLLTNLFLAGHDAAHGSFSRHRWLNRLTARVTFLCCLHPTSSWIHTHHHVHHRATNMWAADPVWRPLSPAEYASRGPLGRAVQRWYRTTLGFAPYYAVETWGRVLMWSSGGRTGWSRLVTIMDRVVVLATAAVLSAFGWQVGGVFGAMVAVPVPFLVLCWVIGFVVYFNHTHPAIPWVDDRRAVGADGGVAHQVAHTVRLTWPPSFRGWVGNIMDHPAHHVHPGVPLSNLDGAQDRLEELLPGRVNVEQWSIAYHRRVVSTCRLFDRSTGRWVDWDGTPRSPALSPMIRSTVTNADRHQPLLSHQPSTERVDIGERSA